MFRLPISICCLCGSWGLRKAWMHVFPFLCRCCFARFLDQRMSKDCVLTWVNKQLRYVSLEDSILHRLHERGRRITDSTMTKSGGWRPAFLLLTVAAVCTCLLLVDFRLPPATVLQLDWWINSTSAEFVANGPNDFEFEKPWQCQNVVKRTVQQRGSQILHSWSDDELFRRALRAEEVLQKSNDGSEDSKSRTHVLDPSVRCRPRAQGSEKPKIAFMFLTASCIPFSRLWERFFQGHEDLYNIYIHGQPDWLTDTGFDESMGPFWGRVVPSGTTHRWDPDLVKAERRLLANALLDDPMNEWFALVSESCIPVRNFGYVYRAMNATNSSRIDCGKNLPGTLMQSRWRARGDTAMLPEVPYSDFRMGSQWFILRRRHAVMVVSDTKYWPKFRQPCPRKEACAPDEHYIHTVVDNLDEGSCGLGGPTFVSWNGTRGGHPQSFGKRDTTAHLIEAVQTQQDGKFLFARKFRPDALDTLLNFTDLLFK